MEHGVANFGFAAARLLLICYYSNDLGVESLDVRIRFLGYFNGLLLHFALSSFNAFLISYITVPLLCPRQPHVYNLLTVGSESCQINEQK